ncbi:MAG: TRAP transporter small permease subunit [Cyclobacteriaceae bacterium]|nr:TRAP transporter small permease subunit [Cyclobacteriaceae bacterium]
MKFLYRYITISERLVEALGRFASWLTLLLVVIICGDVISRYLFNKSSVAIYELEWHVFSLIFLLGASYAFKHDRHVRVDVVYSRLSPKAQAWINLVGTLILLLPFCTILLIEGWDFVSNSYRLLESSADAGGLPARYIIKSAIPVGFLFVIIQAFSVVCKSILILMDRPLNPVDRG